MGRSACPVNGAARSVRPCGPPVLGVFAPSPFRSAGLFYSAAIARTREIEDIYNDAISELAPFEMLIRKGAAVAMSIFKNICISSSVSNLAIGELPVSRRAAGAPYSPGQSAPSSQVPSTQPSAPPGASTVKPSQVSSSATVVTEPSYPIQPSTKRRSG